MEPRTRLRAACGMGKSETEAAIYVERTHLPSRPFNSRLTRKRPACSKVLEMHRAAAAWEDIVYNLVRPLKTLCLEVGDDPQRRRSPRTSAMAAGLTDHVWTVKELLSTVFLSAGNT